MSLTKEDLKKMASPAPVEVTIPGVGVVKIRPLSQKIRTDARAVATTDGMFDSEKFQSFVIMSCVVEPKLDLSDIGWLGELHSGPADKLLNAIYVASGVLEKDDGEKAKK